MKRVDVVYFEASSGHKSAAKALCFGLQKENPDWHIRCVDLGDILKCQTRLLDFIYTNGVKFFNGCMKRERYFFFPTCIKLWIIFARLNTRFKPLRFLLRWTSSFWNDAAPDAIVSVTPMKHTIVYEAARCVNPKAQCITIPVDYREMTPGYWFQPAVKQRYLVGYDGLRKEALAAGVPESDITDLSGMIIDPRFYDSDPIDRTAFLKSMNLDPELPTGVISFGGQGTVNVLRCARKIAERNIPVNLICLCGKNEKLRKHVSEIKSNYPIVANGFTEAPPVDVHRLADFLIGKPGTMTLNEALITRTAFIFIKSRGLQSVQGANEDWVIQNGLGVEANTTNDVDDAVLSVLNSSEIQTNIEARQHEGIFDAVKLITELIESATTLSTKTKAAELQSPTVNVT